MFGFLQRKFYDFWYNLHLQWSAYAYQQDSVYWDDDVYRMSRYYYYERWYANDIFTRINDFADVYKKQLGLYRHIRSIYNPVYRIVEGYVSFTFGNSIDAENLETGSIQIDTADMQLQQDISRLLQTSNWNVHKTLYPRFAAKYGDCFLKVVDTPDTNRVTIEVVDPRLIETMHKDGDDIVYARITYNGYDTETNSPTVFTEEYTLDTIRLFKNVTPFSDTVNGELLREYVNTYGFIPIEHAKFRDNGSLYGSNAFQPLTGKVSEINDVASLLHDNIRNTVQQLYHAKGINKGGISSNADESTRDDVKILYTPSGGEIVPITNALNIEGTLRSIDMMLDEIDKDTPVLSLHKLRDMSVVTKPGAITMASDAIKQIYEIQSNLDTPLERIIVKALIIGTQRGQYSGYGIEMLTNGYGFSLKPREVIDDILSRLEAAQILMQVDLDKATARVTLEKAGVATDRIDQILADAQQMRQDQQDNEITQTLLSTIRGQSNGTTDTTVQPDQ